MATASHEDIWTPKASSGSGGGDYVTCPPDNYPATIAAIFDIGIQSETFNGETKDARKIVLIYELSEKKPDGKPFVLAERYTYSLNGDKAKFKKLIESLYGFKLADDQPVNVKELVGFPCMVNVGNTTKMKDGKERAYHHIAGIAKLPKGMPAPEGTLPEVLWSVRTGEPFPIQHNEWLPAIYGVEIHELASNSKEAKERRRQATADGEDNNF
jgi:hypothetical protein